MRELDGADPVGDVDDDLDDLIQKALAQIRSDRFTLSIYFDGEKSGDEEAPVQKESKR